MCIFMVYDLRNYKHYKMTCFIFLTLIGVSSGKFPRWGSECRF